MEFERFDMRRPPVRTKWYLRPLTYALSAPEVVRHRTVIKKIGTEDLKPPYLLLCNHNAFMDFKVCTKAIFPHRANYVVAIDGFIGRENLLRDVGCICKRKFTNDVTLVRQLRQVIKNGDVAVIYPEARYSLCGTTAVLPKSLGKLAKLLKVPVVTLICHGHHIDAPFWNTKSRGVSPTEAELRLLFTKEELAQTPVDDINEKLVAAFEYDDFRWQKEKGVRVTDKNRAKGLHKVLYQCPHCRTEFHMDSEGETLFCRACAKKWRMTELGELQALSGETEFSHIPDWYEWERENVKREVENGTYSTGKMPVTVDSLPNAKKFIRLGEGVMVHDMNGFQVKITEPSQALREKPNEVISMTKSVASMYSCHIEYDYLGKHGDCVDLNTLENTWYIYPHDCAFSVTKNGARNGRTLLSSPAGTGERGQAGARVTIPMFFLKKNYQRNNNFLALSREGAGEHFFVS